MMNKETERKKFDSSKTPVMDQIGKLLQSWRLTLLDLETRGEEAEVDTKKKINETIQSLKTKKKDLEKYVETRVEGSKSASTEMQKGLKKAAEDIDHAFKMAKEKYLH